MAGMAVAGRRGGGARGARRGAAAACGAAAKDRSPVTRNTPKGGPGTGTERVKRGLPEDFGKNIIPQGSFWRDGRDGTKREPFRNKWGFLSDGLRRACGDRSIKAGNWLGSPPAPPAPSKHIPQGGLRKTPSAKDSRSIFMGWYSYYALYPLLSRNLKDQDVSDGSKMIESGEMVYDSTGIPLLYHAGADILERDALPGVGGKVQREAAAKALPAAPASPAAALPEAAE